jgi:hypothetical protein
MAATRKTARLRLNDGEDPSRKSRNQIFRPLGYRGRSSKNRERSGALDQHPSSAAGEQQGDHLAHQLSAAKHRVVTVHFMTAAIAFGEEAGETRIAPTTARITRQSETDGGTTTEVEQKAQHR